MILASQSPRRIELMREAGYDIRVIPADIDETPFDGEAPLTLVERLARAKAAAVAAEHAEPNELTVAADTIVTFDGNGGTPAVSSMTTIGHRLAFLPGAFRSGSYRFDGWYTERNGGELIATSTVFAANTIV